VPSVFSKEAGLIAVQGALLISRTLLTEFVSSLEGRVGRSIMNAVRRPTFLPLFPFSFTHSRAHVCFVPLSCLFEFGRKFLSSLLLYNFCGEHHAHQTLVHVNLSANIFSFTC
jgi:hypothetical protein